MPQQQKIVSPNVPVVYCKYKPYSLLVMHEGLLEFALLLQDTGQVRVSCSKLWEHLNMEKEKTPLSDGVHFSIEKVHKNKQTNKNKKLTSKAFL